jgi:hypothetical protein
VAELLHKTSANLDGPWLLRKNDLLDLDKVIAEVWQTLDKRRKADLKTATAKAIRHLRAEAGFSQLSPEEQEELEKGTRDSIKGYGRFEFKPFTLLLTLNNGKQTSCTSFAEALAMEDLSEKVVTDIKIQAECAGVRIELSAPHYSSQDIRLWIFPETSPLASEVAARFGAWAEERKPGWARYFTTGHIFLRWFLAVILIGYTYLILRSSETQEKAKLKAEAHKVLRSGINSDNQQRAIYLLLALSSDFTQDSSQAVLPSWYYWFAGFVLGIALLGSFPMNTCFEIGRGAKWVSWRLNWIRFVTKIVPGFILTAILLRLVSSFFVDSLRWW